MNKKSQYLYLLGVLVVALVAGLIIYMVASKVPKFIAVPSTNQTLQNNATTTTNAKVPSKDVAGKLSYEEAVAQYAGRRIQFADCKATPSAMTLKNGTKIMLDNRSANSSTIVINGVSHVLAAYQFKIVTLYSAKLPQTLKFDCTTNKVNSYNVAQVLLQK